MSIENEQNYVPTTKEILDRTVWVPIAESNYKDRQPTTRELCPISAKRGVKKEETKEKEE